MWRVKTSFFSTWIFSCPSTRYCIFSLECSWLHCLNLTDHKIESLFIGLQFCSFYLHSYLHAITAIFDYCSFVVSFRIRKVFFYLCSFQHCFGLSIPFNLHVTVMISFSISAVKVIGILILIALSLYLFGDLLPS